MKAKFLAFAVCMMAPVVASADIKYRVEQISMPAVITPYATDSQSFARDHRFYVGAMYNFSMWDSYTDDNNVFAGGKNTNSFEGVVGVRPYDIFRVELNYIHSDARWSDFKLSGETAMVNAFLDARLNSLYRLFYLQRLVPYVGLGAGITWNHGADNTEIGRQYVPTVGAMAGLGIELGTWFTVDLGYRYLFMLTPQFDAVSDLNPTANQFRAGVRINF